MNEVQLQVPKGPGGKSVAPEDKIGFSRIMYLAGQTSLVNFLCSFIDISPSKSIQNLSHFRCSVVSKRMQKKEMGFARKTLASILGFP